MPSPDDWIGPLLVRFLHREELEEGMQRSEATIDGRGAKALDYLLVNELIHVLHRYLRR